MSDNSSIEWTDATWNPVRGCTKISSGCAHCYAETFAERFRGVPGHPYEQGFDLRLIPEKLNQPLLWRKPKMIFVNSMSDLFHEDVPDDYIVQVVRVMQLASWHTYQILTKRSERQRDLLHSKLRWKAEVADGPRAGWRTYDEKPERPSGTVILDAKLLGSAAEVEAFGDPVRP
jgi:protein gp37